MLFNLLWLMLALPLAGFLLLVAAGARWPGRAVAAVGVGSVGVAALLAIVLGIGFIAAPPPDAAFTQVLWTWMRVETFAPEIAFRLDPLSLVMALVVTIVGFLIHLYSAGFMAREEGYHRFFAYMNLFIASMLVLVLADNLLLLYLGWEGVGLCSFLLIGFWYRHPENGRAAMKAFIVTRIGDAAFVVGLFLLFTTLGTLQIQAVMQQAAAQWAVGSGLAVAAAALLLAGAVGKSAQLPLQVWLPDAMAGPSPVSALIHAATMVTAGVYLIARLHVLFTLAPVVQHLVAVIGVATLLLAAFSALTQWDVKRVLAYSTISQVGYMFLALGVGAWSAAIFHLATHAFFKALLFLAAGVVILNLHDEHDMRKMGGLRDRLPLVYRTFLIGAFSLAALPLVTAGFYSKDLILYQAWASAQGSAWLWAGAWLGAILTGLYAFRMVFLVFFGRARQQPAGNLDRTMSIPLVTLAICSVVAGFIELPPMFGGFTFLSDFLHPVLPSTLPARGTPGIEIALQFASVLASVIGILLAYQLYRRRPDVSERWRLAPIGAALHRLWQEGWGFDWFYDRLFVRPYHWLTAVNRQDVVDYYYNSLAWTMTRVAALARAAENGNVRWYAAGVAIGAVLLIALLVLL